MKSIAKADSWMRDLKQELDLRIKGSATIDTSRLARDANGWPILFLSDAANEAAGQPVIAVRIKGQSAVSPDVFGNAVDAFAPHILELAYELTAAGKPTPAGKDVALVQILCARLSIRTQLKEIANTTAVTEASINADSVELDLDWMQFPTKLG